jgi:hypothetical protein
VNDMMAMTPKGRGDVGVDVEGREGLDCVDVLP